LQGHVVKGQGHATTTTEIMCVVAHEPPNGFEPKPTQICITLERRTNYVFKVMGLQQELFVDDYTLYPTTIK